ncbi:FecR family protein [Puia sp.]|uniref:FecR family protein n=1 Tax=Puia sp. TaxID=2045100 RepID=UPI002F408791
MSNEEYNTLEDLVFSRSFRTWVLTGDTPEADFWSDWATRNPGKTELVNQAKAVIYALQLDLRPLPEEAVDAEVRKALQKVQDGRLTPVREVPLRPGILGRHYSRAWTAAAIVAAIAIGIWSIRFFHQPRQEGFYPTFLAVDPAKPIHQQTAPAGTEKWLTLPDGSTARLTPGSKLSWPADHPDADHPDADHPDARHNGRPGRQRAVFLEGEAFFNITHSASLPFFVYTRNVITKVLGTSFTVNTNSGKTIVSVSTGKVSVYHKKDLSDGMILTPNQQSTYDPGKDHLDKALIARPVALETADSTAGSPGPAPVAAVFRGLQNRYGIPILYDEEAVAGCTLRVPMGNEPFYEKLNVVCKAIGATYEAIDGNIVITAAGCK